MGPESFERPPGSPEPSEEEKPLEREELSEAAGKLGEAWGARVKRRGNKETEETLDKEANKKPEAKRMEEKEEPPLTDTETTRMRELGATEADVERLKNDPRGARVAIRRTEIAREKQVKKTGLETPKKEGWQEKGAERKEGKKKTKTPKKEPLSELERLKLERKKEEETEAKKKAEKEAEAREKAEREKEKREREEAKAKERGKQKEEAEKKKVEEAKQKRTGLEKREARRKRWEEMSEEERREKYGKTFEIRERLIKFDKARANLAVLERETNLNPKDEEIRGGYEAALGRYQEARAEYIGTKAWRMLKERTRAVEENTARRVEGKFETFRKGWRWLGEQNAEKLVSKTGWQPKNRFAKFALRMMSLRTAASVGLLGGGMVLGFGSATGIGLLAARRVMGGLGTTFGSYDLMKMAEEKKALALNEKKVGEMESPKLEEKMAEFEARARLSGIQVVRSREYELLRNEYLKRIEGMSEEDKKLAEKAQSVDKFLRERHADITRGEKQRKIAAVGVGILSVGAFSAGEIAEKFQGIPGAPSAEGLEEAAGAVRGGEPMLTPDQADSAGVRPPAGAGAPPGEPTPETPSAGGAEVPPPGGAAEAVAAEAVEREAREAAENHISTIKKGEGVWQTSRRLVASGAITENQWKEAIGNAASKATLPGGTEIHISELHLVHEGDQVIYVPGEGEAPGHFEVRDYADDNLNFGNARDLAEAMKQEGHWGHKSHEWLYDKLDEYPEGYAPTKVPEGPPPAPQPGQIEPAELPTPAAEAVPAGAAPAQEVLEQAARGALEVAPQELSFDWGTARFVLDEQGRIADVLIQETAGLEKRPELVNRAAEELLQSSYIRTLERGVSEDVRHLVMPGRIAQAKESAWEVFKFKQLLESITDSTSSEAYFLRYKVKALAGAHELKLDARIFKSFRF